MGKVKLGGKELERYGFLQENPLEGSGFCFVLKGCSSFLASAYLWVLTVSNLLHPANNQLRLRVYQW